VVTRISRRLVLPPFHHMIFDIDRARSFPCFFSPSLTYSFEVKIRGKITGTNYSFLLAALEDRTFPPLFFFNIGISPKARCGTEGKD